MPVHLLTTSATSSSVDLFLQHLPLGLELLEPLVLLRELLLELDQPAEPQLGRALQVAVALGAVELVPDLFDLRLQLADLPDALLLLLPVRGHALRLLAQVGELLLQARQPLLRGVVGLLLERDALDLELLDAPRHLVDLDRHRVDLDPQAGRRLVDQVDRLVGQEPAGDVAVGQHGGRHQRRVLDPHAVVHLVLLLQPAQDRDRVLDARLLDQHRLEPTLERRVLLDVLAVLVERGRADRAELTAREHRLQHVAGVHRALGRAGADDRVQLVDERDDLALAVGDLLQDGLQPLLELAAVLRAGDHRPEVQRDHALVLERLGDVAGHDPLRQPLDDRGLAHAGLADQDGVVLRPARQHLDHAAHLFVAADHRVELAATRLLGQVAAVALQRLVLLLGVLVGDALTSAHLGERRQHAVAREAGLLQDARRARVDLEQRQQQVLGRDVLVGERLGLFARRVQHRAGGRRDPHVGGLALRVHLGDAVERLVDLVAHRLRRDADLVQQRVDDALGIGEQREQHVLGLDRLVVARHGLLVRPLQRRLGLDRQLVEVHPVFTSS